MRTEAAVPAETPSPAAVFDHGPESVDQRRLAAGAAKVIGLLAVPATGLAALAAGWPGVAGALVGLGFVLLLFGASALLLAWVTERTTGAVGVLLLAGGSVVRLVMYLATLFALNDVAWVHGRSLAAATGVAVAVTLAYELRLLAGMQRLFWVDAAAGRPSPADNDTRSQPL